MHDSCDPQRIAAGFTIDGWDMNRRRRNKPIDTPFVPHRIEMLESPAYRALSRAGHRVLARLEIEHLKHAGYENGRLPVTFGDFEKYGMDPHSIAPAQREVQALGFAEITERGRPSKSDFGRHPHHWRLTYLHGPYDQEPSHEWKRHQTLNDALVADVARKAKDAKAVAKSKERAAKKQMPGVVNPSEAGWKTHPVKGKRPRGETHPTVPRGETHPTIYISDGREDAA
jgi:hypothetical protein